MTEKKQKIQLPEFPFPGIDPFNYAERNVFFAREQESRALIRLVVIHRGVLLYSDSGTGKSSLINAGLLPHAVTEGFQPEKIRVQPRPGEEIIVERLSETGRSAPPFLPSIFAAGEDEERVVLSVADFLKTIRKKAQAARPLLIFDQFEEWFTLFEEGARGKAAVEAQAAQETICDAIISLLRDSKLPVKILLVLREDYLAKLTPFFKRYPNLPDQYLRLTALKGKEIKRIIRGPFEEYAGRYEPEIPEALAQTIRKEFESRSGGEPVRLSEVQIVCRTLYESGKAGHELEAHFDDQGGVQGILEEYLRLALESLPKNQRDPAVGLLSRMVTAAGTRNVISGEDVMSRVENEDKISRNILEKTLGSLEQETKLVRRERRREVYYYEISSEFLVGWIRVKAGERAERLRMEETERALLEERKRAEEQERISRTLRRRAWWLAISFALVLAAIVVAFFGWKSGETAREGRALERARADQEKKAREIEQKINQDLEAANAEKDSLNIELGRLNANLILETEKAVTSQQEAENNLKEVIRLRRSAKARDLAILAPLQSGSDPMVGALLAQQSYRLDTNTKFPDEVYNALRRTLNALAPEMGGPVKKVEHQDWARAIAFNRNKKSELASGGADGKIILWKLAESKSKPDRLVLMKNLPEGGGDGGHKGSVRSLRFHPSRHILASCGEDSTVRLWWDLKDMQILNGHQGSVWTVAFSPDGRLLASAGADSTVILWRVEQENDNAIFHRFPKYARVRSVVFSSDGRLLAAAGDDGKIRVWQFNRLKTPLHTLDHRSRSPVRAIAFQPNADILLAGLENKNLWFWDLSKKSPQKQFVFTHEDRVNSVAFSRDGKLFASASADESIRIWPWNKRNDGPIVLRDHKSWVWSIDFSNDGKRIVTGGSDQTVRSWIISSETLSQRICEKVDRKKLSLEEWQKYVGNEKEGFPYEDSCFDTNPELTKK